MDFAVGVERRPHPGWKERPGGRRGSRAAWRSGTPLVEEQTAGCEGLGVIPLN